MTDLSAYGKGTGGYGSRDYVRDYLKNGSLPDIHEDIQAAMESVWHGAVPAGGVLDMGACTGLLSVRLKRMGFPVVLGVEPFLADVMLFNEVIRPTVEGVRMNHGAIDVNNGAGLSALGDALKTYDVKTVVMRRVLPEVLAKFGDRAPGSPPSDVKKAVLIPGGGARLAQMFVEAGVRYLVIEGRVYSPRSKHPLAKLDYEVAQMQPRFREIKRFRNVSIMEVCA